MSKYTIEINEECSKILKPIVEFTKQEPSTIVEDLIQTFCDIPFIVASDLDEFCITKTDECDKVDPHRKLTFTDERIKKYSRIQFFTEIIYKSQAEQLKKLKESDK